MRLQGLYRVAAAVSTGLWLAGTVACAHSDYSRRRDGRLEGHRYETMRALARDLDDRAHAVAEDAAARRGRHGDELAEAADHFARRAAEFRSRIERRRHDDRSDVEEEVHHLDDDARKVSERIRTARVSERTWDEWEGAMNALEGMNRLLAGYAADVTYRDRWR